MTIKLLFLSFLWNILPLIRFDFTPTPEETINKGQFSITVAPSLGLQKNTTYYFRSYLTTSSDTFYGENKSVITQTMLPSTGFSPNGNGINDSWVTPEIKNYQNSEVNIFNTASHLVFKSKSSYKNNWNGAYKGKGKLPAGCYLYAIDLENSSFQLKRICS